MRIRRMVALSLLLILGAAPVNAVADTPPKHGAYQLDFIAISTAIGHVDLYQSQVADMVARLNSSYSKMTNGQITFELRTLLPPISTSQPIKSTPDMVALVKQTPAGAGYAGVITIGVIPTDGTLPFAGMAWGPNYLLVNTDFNASFSVLTHEIGHNLGLAHAAAGKCDASGVCRANEYGDYSDVMGQYLLGNIPGATIARLSSLRLDQLGVLDSSAIAYADTTTDITLSPTYGSTPGVKLLYIPIDNQNGYAIEYRPAIGDELQLMATQIPIPGQNMYYPNIPSYGVMVRQLFGFGNDFNSAAPKYTFSGYIDLGASTPAAWSAKMSMLIVNFLEGRQGFDQGASLTLFDGSVVTVGKSDPTTGAIIHISRPAPSIALTFDSSSMKASWAQDDQLANFLDADFRSVVIPKTDSSMPTANISFMIPRTSSRLTSAKLLDNGTSVSSLGYSDLALTNNTTAKFSYQPATIGTHKFALQFTTALGESVTSTPLTLTSAYAAPKVSAQVCISKPGWEPNCQPYPKFTYAVCISIPTGTLYYQSGSKWIALSKVQAKLDSATCTDSANKYYEVISANYPSSKPGKINFKVISKGNKAYSDLTDTFAVTYNLSRK